MPVAHDRRVDRVAEHVAPQQRRHPLVQMRHVGQPAAQHDHVGVQHVDDHRQPARQPVGMPLQRRLRAPRPRPQPAPAAAAASGAPPERGQARARQGRAPGSRAARTSTAAADTRPAAARAAACGPTRRRSGAARPAPARPPRCRRRSPCRGSRRTRSARPAPPPSAASLSAKQLASFSTRTGRPIAAVEVPVQRVADQDLRVGVLHQPGRRADHARNADARRSPARRPPTPPLRPAPPSRRMISGYVPGVSRPAAQPDVARRVEHGDLRLGAAQVDADTMAHVCAAYKSVPLLAQARRSGGDCRHERDRPRRQRHDLPAARAARQPRAAQPARRRPAARAGDRPRLGRRFPGLLPRDRPRADRPGRGGRRVQLHHPQARRPGGGRADARRPVHPPRLPRPRHRPAPPGMPGPPAPGPAGARAPGFRAAAARAGARGHRGAARARPPRRLRRGDPLDPARRRARPSISTATR